MPKEDAPLPSLQSIPDSAWQSLAQKRIFFGHQSVGFNIVQGIEDLMRENPQIKLNLVETDDPAAFDGPVFAHARNGSNNDPHSKCVAFTRTLEKGIGGKVDIAVLKFCYVDFSASSQVAEIFSDYRRTLDHLKQAFPNTTFVHVTVPLTTVQTGFKVPIKKLIGRAIDGYEENIVRNRFNFMLRAEFAGKEPFFDLARAESTFAVGTRSLFELQGKTYEALAPEYTKDGGHLNPEGRKKVAEQLLIALARLAEQSPSGLRAEAIAKGR